MADESKSQQQDANATGDGTGGASPNAGITFTPEQQAHIDALVSDRLKRAQGKAETDAQATRTERDTLAGKLATLAKTLGKDTSDAVPAAIAEMITQLEASNRRASFAEESGKPEIGCTNPRVAFATAQAEGLFDARGNVNWQALKTAAPELFRVRAPEGNAGAGTGTPPAATKSMNTFIRSAAGR